MQLLAVVFVDFITKGLFPLAEVVKLITGAVRPHDSIVNIFVPPL